MSEQDEAGRPCAICGKPQLAEFRPFCSKRCADIDLGRWLKGNYIIPGVQTDESERQDSPTAPDRDVE